jgi:hypothetical protein
LSEIVKACEELMKKYGNLPFDIALPYLQKGWEDIGRKHGIRADEVFIQYMDWKSKQE